MDAPGAGAEQLAEYDRHDRTLRELFRIEPGTIVGGTADAVLLSMRALVVELARDLGRCEFALLDAEEEAARAERAAIQTPYDQLHPPKDSPRVCFAVSPEVEYQDHRLNRRSRTRCRLERGHDGAHLGTLGNGRDHEWS